MKFKKAVLAVSALSSLAFANPTELKDQYVGLEMGYGFGGDTLAEVEFDDGSTDSIDAGAGLYFGINLQKPLHEQGEQPVNLKVALSYMFDSISAENGDMDFSRMPIDLIISTDVNRWQIGAGATYHLNPTLEADIGTLDAEVEADNALGFVFETAYTFSAGNGWKNSYIGLKYTNIEYDFSGAKFDGSGFAISLGTTY